MEERKIYVKFFRQTTLKGGYKQFQVTPSLLLIKDSQFTTGRKTESGVIQYHGYYGYEAWLSWLGFEIGIGINFRTDKF